MTCTISHDYQWQNSNSGLTHSKTDSHIRSSCRASLDTDFFVEPRGTLIKAALVILQGRLWAGVESTDHTVTHTLPQLPESISVPVGAHAPQQCCQRPCEARMLVLNPKPGQDDGCDLLSTYCVPGSEVHPHTNSLFLSSLFLKGRCS